MLKRLRDAMKIAGIGGIVPLGDFGIEAVCSQYAVRCSGDGVVGNYCDESTGAECTASYGAKCSAGATAVICEGVLDASCPTLAVFHPC